MLSERRPRRLPGGRTIAVAAAAALLGGGVALAAVEQLEGGTPADHAVPGVDLTSAEGVGCAPTRRPSPGSDAVLSRLFEVEDDQGRRYLLGWTLTPYTGARSYEFGDDGNLLALQPELGGVPLGYGSGSVRVDADDEGTIDARIDLRAGGTLRVSGRWSCGR